MRLLILGHSAAHVRQISFFRSMGNNNTNVLLLAPSEWGNLKPRTMTTPTFELLPMLTIGAPDMYNYRWPHLEVTIRQYRPDIIYVMQEIGCHITRQAFDLADIYNARKVLFVWENIKKPTPEESALLERADLCICGNDDAYNLHVSAPRRVILPQVGVDIDHFAARPGITRDTDVGFIGRPVTEKGIYTLEQAWPTAKITPWMEWLKLPWALSGLRVLATPSIDTQFWREQAMPYAAAEAVANGCYVVVSDAGSIPFWWERFTHEQCPGVLICKQNDANDLRAKLFTLASAWKQPNNAGREWVVKYLSSAVIADCLWSEFEQICQNQ